jgi:hypothetical protein
MNYNILTANQVANGCKRSLDYQEIEASLWGAESSNPTPVSNNSSLRRFQGSIRSLRVHGSVFHNSKDLWHKKMVHYLECILLK